MNITDLIPVMLLVLLGAALLTGASILFWAFHVRRKQVTAAPPSPAPELFAAVRAVPAFAACPVSWLAIRSRNLRTVQNTLRLSNPHPCRLIQGLAQEQKLFIAPPVQGWILVTGSGLPDPGDDIDALFRFLVNISRKLGHVQYFHAHRILGHHGWARVENGRVLRGYAWAGRTLWNQGVKSRPELELGFRCFQYFDSEDGPDFENPDSLTGNVEKIPLLAARWSIDPTSIDERTLEHACGVAGEPPRLY
ncbi:MAG TPA: hypothetical protein GYA07_12235 [Verrucomicrobia bacterium]|nr:hypothetical protein [Verrucomicrobiota bacterium]HOB33721.1 hypothetical protein [Verrucomicrobiota bacterium]HOP98896.1 hypothetical protein [Verrucomicrobiota bacterium]HPU55799.1 hypothetical protein [Verrucomicrobiota bacterium]